MAIYDGHEMGLMTEMVTITQNDMSSELIAHAQRGPCATPTTDEKVAYLLTWCGLDVKLFILDFFCKRNFVWKLFPFPLCSLLCMYATRVYKTGLIVGAPQLELVIFRYYFLTVNAYSSKY